MEENAGFKKVKPDRRNYESFGWRLLLLKTAIMFFKGQTLNQTWTIRDSTT